MKDAMLKKFNKLSQTTPDVAWAFDCKQKLMEQVALTLPEKKSNWFGLLTWKTEKFALHLVSSAPKVITAIASFVIIIGTTGFAAEASFVPNKPLYTVKQTIEKFELMLATSPEKESEVYAKHMQKRVYEVEQIIKSNNLSDSEKEINLKTIIRSIEKNASNVSTSFSQAQQEGGNENLTKLALTISQSAKQASNSLNSVINNGQKNDTKLAQGSAATAASKAVNITDLAETDALLVLAKNVDGKKPNVVVEKVELQNESKEIEIAPGSVINEIVMNDLINARLVTLEKRINELARRVKFEPSNSMKKVLADNQLEAEKLNNFFKRSQLIAGYVRQAVADGKFSAGVEIYNSLNKETNDMLESVNKMLINVQIEEKSESVSAQKAELNN